MLKALVLLKLLPVRATRAAPAKSWLKRHSDTWLHRPKTAGPLKKISRLYERPYFVFGLLWCSS
jgi:hypothetical protein